MSLGYARGFYERAATASTSRAIAAAASDARATRRRESSRSGGWVGEQPPDLLGQARARQLAVGDHDSGAGFLHPAGIRGLVVGGGVRVGNQYRRAAVRSDSEDRATRASHDKVAGHQRLTKLGDVTAQLIVGSGRVQVWQVALSGRVQHAEAGSGERLNRGTVDRARALRSPKHEHAGVVGGDSEALARSQAIGGGGGTAGR